MKFDIPEIVKGGFTEKGVRFVFCLLLDCFKQSHLSPQVAQTQHKCTHSFCKSSLKTRNNVPALKIILDLLYTSVWNDI